MKYEIEQEIYEYTVREKMTLNRKKNKALFRGEKHFVVEPKRVINQFLVESKKYNKNNLCE